MKLFVFALLPLLLSCASAQKSNSLAETSLTKADQAYLAFPDYRKVSLSQTGQYVAVASALENRIVVSVLDRATKKTITAVPLEENLNVQSFIWTPDNRLIVQAIYSEGYLKAGFAQQMILAMNFDGTKQKVLFPRRKKGASTTSFTKSFFSLVTPQIIDEKYLLVAERQYSVGKPKYQLSKVNIYNGNVSLYDRVKMQAGSYGLDNQFRPRLAYKVDKKYNITFYTKNLKTKSWDLNNFFSPKSRNISFIGFEPDNKTFYFLGDNKKSIKALYKAQISKTGKVTQMKEIFSHGISDITGVGWDRKGKVLAYVEYGTGKPQRKYLSTGKYAQLAKNLQASFPNEPIFLGSQHGDFRIVGVRSDRRPTTYYLFNHKRQSVSEFLSSNEAIRPYPKVGSQSVSYKTRDGQTIYGFLYQPKNASATTPLIINIHGGPFGVTDRWGYNGDTQFLVSRGYSVLQVNYRGSGGRGYNFEKLGYKKVGSSMQDDIADAALWAIQTKWATRGKIGLWGVSYGAYSSVMSLHKYPELFSAAIGFGGVYDWRTILDQGDSKGNESSQNYWDKRIPDSDADRFKASPVSLASRLQRPLYIMHGEEDVRCSVKQARGLKKVLEKNKKSFQYKEFPEIGHWFVTDQKQKNEAYNEIISFFDRHLKI